MLLQTTVLTQAGLSTQASNQAEGGLPANSPTISDSPDLPVQNPYDESWQVVKMRVTAYCPCAKCCGKWADGITANGHRIESGETFVAADKAYSFGTELVIPGYNNDNPVKVLDRGKAIVGDKIDVFFPTHQEAKNWGVRNLDVKIKS